MKIFLTIVVFSFAYFTILFCISLHLNLEDIRVLNVLKRRSLYPPPDQISLVFGFTQVNCDFSLQQCQCLFGLLRWLSDKESTCQCRRLGFNPWVGKIPRRRKQQPDPVFFPGKRHRQCRLEDYHPWGHKESDMIERLSTRTYFISYILYLIQNS